MSSEHNQTNTRFCTGVALLCIVQTPGLPLSHRLINANRNKTKTRILEHRTN